MRKIFRKDHRVAIVQNPRDPFRIRIGTVSGALLQTRIPTLKLNPRQQYNPFEALGALEVTSEFNAAIQKLHLYNGLVVMSGRLLDPEPDLPHLPPVLKNVTIGQVLDAIAKTFQGIVSYGEVYQSCRQNGLFCGDFQLLRKEESKVVSIGISLSVENEHLDTAHCHLHAWPAQTPKRDR